MRDFPKARVLLFMYESAWTGPLQVQQFMGNIAKQLLTALRSVRKVRECHVERGSLGLTLNLRMRKDPSSS